MSCQQVQSELSLYLYGELDFASEERVEQHLAECQFCQQALAREKSWHANLRSDEAGPSIELLSECRQELRRAIGRQRPRGISFGSRVRSWFDVPILDWASRGALACFLVILGFGMGRWAGPPALANGPESQIPFAASMIAPGARIQEVRSSVPGQVRIVIEQVRQSEIYGSLNDARIRQFILAATQRCADPAVRVDSVQVLSGQNSLDVRDALLASVRRDPNAAVRLKALEALRPFASELSTRQALREVLETDADPAVRAEAINVLVPATQTIEVTPELVDTLQNIVRSDQNDDYVRTRALQILQGTGSLSDSY